MTNVAIDDDDLAQIGILAVHALDEPHHCEFGFVEERDGRRRDVVQHALYIVRDVDAADGYREALGLDPVADLLETSVGHREHAGNAD